MRKMLWLVVGVISMIGCVPNEESPVSSSGVSQKTAKITTDTEGYTVEQRNIMNRLAIDNKPGSVKHLYLVSPFNGRQIFYATVKGKVTSSGKRLTPKSVNWRRNGLYTDNDTKESYGISNDGIAVSINDRWCVTNELIQDDGVYGDSSEYIYFWNENGQYIQLYVGGLAVVISDQPVSFQDVVLRTETESSDK